MYVLDTSVVYKWYQEEEYTHKALKIREEYLSGHVKISVPDLILIELSNIIKFKKNSHSEDIKTVLDNFVSLRIDIVTPTLELVEKAGELAFKYNITIYDAIYFALANEIKYMFITADNNLYKKIHNVTNVKALKDM